MLKCLFIVVLFNNYAGGRTEVDPIEDILEELKTKVEFNQRRVDTSAESKCFFFDRFYGYLDRVVYDDSGTFAAVSNAFLSRIYGDGRIARSELVAQYKEFLVILDAALEDNPTRAFGKEIAGIFNSDKCRIHDKAKAYFVFKYFKEGLCDDLETFLTTFLRELRPESRNIYILNTVQYFVRCDSDTTKLLNRKLNEDKDKSIADFVKFYKTVVEVEALGDSAKKGWRCAKILDEGLETTGVYLIVYAVYQLRALTITNRPLLAALLDNPGLYYLTEYTTAKADKLASYRNAPGDVEVTSLDLQPFIGLKKLPKLKAVEKRMQSDISTVKNSVGSRVEQLMARRRGGPSKLLI